MSETSVRAKLGSRAKFPRRGGSVCEREKFRNFEISSDGAEGRKEYVDSAVEEK
jgi:hypothetical protein